VNEKFSGIRKPLLTDPKYTRARYLDPDNPKSGKKEFYSPTILAEFDKHYTRKASNTAAQFEVQLSPAIQIKIRTQ
jgi:hypothetical protein